MVKSMTGFGRFEALDGQRKITVELKSVNHRYFDLNIRMPKRFISFESEIRNIVRQYTGRGKIDMFITYEDFSEKSAALKCNMALAKEYAEHFKEISEQLCVDYDIKASTFLRCPDVFSMDELSGDEDELLELLKEAVNGACKKFDSARIAEGEALKADILLKLDCMAENVLYIEQRYPDVIKEYRKRLTDKINEFINNSPGLVSSPAVADEARILTEVAIYADKICVDEEMVRLKSHIEAVRKALNFGDGMGRKLDFLAQELNREANTTLSKSTDLNISDRAVELKTDIEKIREQVQNIE